MRGVLIYLQRDVQGSSADLTNAGQLTGSLSSRFKFSRLRMPSRDWLRPTDAANRKTRYDDSLFTTEAKLNKTEHIRRRWNYLKFILSLRNWMLYCYVS